MGERDSIDTGLPLPGPRPTTASRLDGTAKTSSAPAQLLHLATAIAVVAALYFGKAVLVPITLAILLSFVLAPVVNMLLKRRLPRALAVGLTMAMALGLLGGLGVIVAGQASNLAADAPRYASTIETKVESVRDYATQKTAALAHQFASSPSSEGARKAAAERSKAATAPKAQGAAPMPVEVHQPEPSPLEVARAIAMPILGPLEIFVIVMVITTFILFGREDLRDRFIRVFGGGDLHRTTAAMDDAGSRLSRYFLAQLAVNTTFGAVIWGGLYFIGIPSAGLWAVLAGLLRFIPYIGSVLGAVPPLLLGAAIDPGWSIVGHVALLFAVTEPIMGYAVEPLLYGRSTGLSPISVLVAALFWTWVWGPVGLFLSTPLTLCVVVLGRHVESLGFIDVLLGDRPPLTPVEMFYQRILGSDPDAALDYAEQLVEDHRLDEFYDETARPTLMIASADLRRGAMAADKAGHIADATLAMVQYLEEHDDKAPESKPVLAERWTRPGAIACLAGRGSFDVPVTAMAAQLLQRQGFGTESVAGNDPLLGNAGIICLVHAGLSGNPAHLRFLVRRVQSLAPGVPIIIGCWEGDAGKSAEAMGAVRNVDSLRGLVSACLQLAAPPAPARVTDNRPKASIAS